ncbi:type II toxin-antitoxin system VapC family toxin [Geminocystis sp.]|uniref:type II toxin-antitoxin system VapC family toxin n=1 Tax=Geminocystis sp. TaxID=2664100 RepID=UPI003594824A
MYLLDTNHCSNLIFGELKIINKIEEISTEKIAISVVTEAELMYMAENSQRIVENLAIVEEFLKDIPVYNIDSKVNKTYAKLKGKIMNYFAPKDKNKRRKTKISNLGIGENDLWIGSTAIINNLIIVSADKDFIRMK